MWSYASFYFQFWINIFIFFVEKMNEHHRFLFTKTDSFERKNQSEWNKKKTVFFREFGFRSILQSKSHVHGPPMSRSMHVGDASVALFRSVICGNQVEQFFFCMTKPLFSRIFHCWRCCHDHFNMIGFYHIHRFYVADYVPYRHMASAKLDRRIAEMVFEFFARCCIANFNDFIIYIIVSVFMNYNQLSRIIYQNCHETCCAEILFYFFFHSDLFNDFCIFECCHHFSTVFTWFKFSSRHFNLGWPRRIGSPSEVRRFGADGSIFGRKSDPIAEAEANIFENPIRFKFKIFCRIGSDSFLFFVGSEGKNCFRSDPMATLF